MNLGALRIGEPEGLVDALGPRLKNCTCAEDACSVLSAELYDRCREADDDESARALVLSRIYLSLPYSALDDGSAAFVREKFALDPAPGDLFLTLMGTRGDAPAWCDRRLSNGHRAIPLNRTTVATVPMLARCFQQIGFDLDLVLKSEAGIHLDGVSSAFGLFHVDDALGSPFVPAQKDFVEPYQVRSVVGCGAMLPNGAVSIWIGFARVTISPGAALPLIPMMPAFWHVAQTFYRRKAFFAT